MKIEQLIKIDGGNLSIHLKNNITQANSIDSIPAMPLLRKHTLEGFSLYTAYLRSLSAMLKCRGFFFEGVTKKSDINRNEYSELEIVINLSRLREKRRDHFFSLYALILFKRCTILLIAYLRSLSTMLKCRGFFFFYGGTYHEV